ncbi:cache domain-containing protein [Cohnella rhizosphaerae]|uniref:Cache domain-containing protein n=1 Tax=Cohnella rhizosphaerae TaxID=1457232 RepID=A0A9X4QT40_9BACL|nr:cache domain-containing protein [Cohnella rhizosphaerae]MDG0809954.1 cache domain-containing protein [Cohnella rhizosphaerae]
MQRTHEDRGASDARSRPAMIYSLRGKVALTFVVLFMIPFIAVIVMLSRQASDIIGSSVEASALQSMDQYTTYLRTVMAQAENVGQQAIGSDVLQKWTTARLSGRETEYERYRVTQSLRQYFYSLVQFNPTVASIEVYDDQGGFVGLQGDDAGEPFLSADWYKAAQASIAWLAARPDPLSDEGTEMNGMTLPIVHLASLEKIGVLKVDVRTDLLREPLEKIRLGRSGAAFLLDRSGKPILGQDLARAQGLSAAALQAIAADAADAGEAAEPRMKRSGSDGILFYRQLPEVDWLLVGWVPEKGSVRQGPPDEAFAAAAGRSPAGADPALRLLAVLGHREAALPTRESDEIRGEGRMANGRGGGADPAGGRDRGRLRHFRVPRDAGQFAAIDQTAVRAARAAKGYRAQGAAAADQSPFPVQHARRDQRLVRAAQARGGDRRDGVARTDAAVFAQARQQLGESVGGAAVRPQIRQHRQGLLRRRYRGRDSGRTGAGRRPGRQVHPAAARGERRQAQP